MPFHLSNQARKLFCLQLTWSQKVWTSLDIQLVINSDMPEEIENYVHRIVRTGGCWKTGLETTFIDHNQTETTLLDLKHLLVEAKQRIPPMLADLTDPRDDLDAINGACGFSGCGYCGGLGHRMLNCPKLEHQKTMAIANISRECEHGHNRD